MNKYVDISEFNGYSFEQIICSEVIANRPLQKRILCTVIPVENKIIYSVKCRTDTNYPFMTETVNTLEEALEIYNALQ